MVGRKEEHEMKKVAACILALILAFSAVSILASAENGNERVVLIIDANGGRGSTDESSVGELRTILRPAYKKGNICLGYAVNPNATEPEYYFNEIYTFTEPRTVLYAVYKKIQTGDIYDTVNIQYKDFYTIEFEDFEPTLFVCDRSSTVYSVFHESNKIEGTGRGTGYVYVYDADGNQRIIRFNVRMNFRQWLESTLDGMSYTFWFGLVVPLLLAFDAIFFPSR